MKITAKKRAIKKLTKKLLKESYKEAEKKIDKAINSGALNIDDWSAEYNSFIIPKIIIVSILENEAEEYKATNTSFEKEVKKEVKNLKLFI